MNTKQKSVIIQHLKTTKYFLLDSIEEKRRLVYNDDFIIDYAENNHITFDGVIEAAEKYQATEAKKKATRAKNKLEKELSKKVSDGNETADEHIQQLPEGKYVLTCAQNNTDIDTTFFNSLLTYCKENEATLLIAKMPYNKAAFLQPFEDDQEIWYDPKLTKYLVDDQIKLGENFQFVANANVLPTAKNPLSGFEGMTDDKTNIIIPASKIALKSLARLKGATSKFLFSTGTVTKRNYIMRKAGSVATIEHCISAVFVDTKTKQFRHLEQMTGFKGFYDLGYHYYITKEKVNAVEALQLGDIHAEKAESQNIEKSKALINELQPKNLVIHDLFDFSSRNHHNIKDCAFMYQQYINNNSVEYDIIEMASILDVFIGELPENSKTHIIESNHDLAINRWLKETDFKTDPANAKVYLTCMLELYKYIEETTSTDFNMLEFVYSRFGKGENVESIDFHGTDESLKIAGVEMGIHGHTGINGARGTPQSFRSLGIPCNTGHTHSPSIIGKVYTAGVTASLEMGYNIGLSSWVIAHIVTYENGQRQIIIP